MATVVLSPGGHLNSKLSRSLEKILEEAYLSGELRLSGRKLKDFPNSGGKYNLSDTIIADLSKNRFAELPLEVTDFCSLESLHLYHNTIRTIPDCVVYLQCLTFLDLSRNQLSVLPAALCGLPLEILLVSNNKLVAVPEEIGRMKTLAELDASCNEISYLPRQVGDLPLLRALNVRRNQLKELPLEITCLRLVKLDISENKIATLPNELRAMTSLVDFQLSHNPLTSPPAHLCMRGRVHIFKYLEIQAIKDVKKRGIATQNDARRPHRKAGGHLSDLRGYSNSLANDLRQRRYNVDSGYSTSDGGDRRWSQEVANGEEEVSSTKGQWMRPGSAPIPVAPAETRLNGSCSGTSTPSTISPGDSMNLDEEIEKTMILNNPLERKRLESNSRSETDLSRRIVLSNDCVKQANGSARYPPNSVSQVPPMSPSHDHVFTNGNGVAPCPDDKRPLEHIQTYREYKEALKMQRGQDVYRPRCDNTNNDTARANQPAEPPNYETTMRNRLESNPVFDESASKRPVQKVIPSRISSSGLFQAPPAVTSLPMTNGNSRNGSAHEPCYVKPSSPIKTVPGSPKLVTTSVGYVNGKNGQAGSPRSPKLGARAMMWNRDVAPEKLSFTMRREFDKAREEAELIDQLRSLIETKLKMALPDNMAPALMDGVVLCHLANHVRPRSVASIHVPSPAVPKLTMARCRRNVDNFLEACRKIGVEEGLICCAADVLEGRGLVQMAITVTELMRFHQPRSPAHAVPCP